MDTKGAAEAMLKAAAPMAAEEEAMLKALARKEEAAPAPAGAGPWTTTEGIKGAAAAAAKRYWASLKSQARAAGEYTTHKARAAGEYATLRTRQGVALFGEPNIGPIKTIVDRC
ncbi:uncharacterized protein LOC125552938 [Triticum urartu]|uniref:uncharacterized protein LOC125552938 n=1 Tax=Triticum urartu TaxID=4572 RepID=UPI002042C8B2|nr:uncharacterized protein LOC125552938 [Triticum urartu]